MATTILEAFKGSAISEIADYFPESVLKELSPTLLNEVREFKERDNKLCHNPENPLWDYSRIVEGRKVVCTHKSSPIGTILGICQHNGGVKVLHEGGYQGLYYPDQLQYI